MNETKPVVWKLRARNLFVSLWTALWLYLSLGMVLLSFSAIQFQAQIENDARRAFVAAGEKGPANTGAIRITVAQIELSDRHYRDDLELYRRMTVETAKAGPGDPRAAADVSARVESLTRELYPKLFPNAAAVPDDVIAAVQDSCKSSPETTKDLCSKFSALVDTGVQGAGADAQDSPRNRLLAVKDRIDGYERSTVFTEAAEIESYRQVSQLFFPWLPMLLPALPHPILVMIVTLSMGALGSALFMLQIQLAGKPAGYQSTVSWHFFRPLQGMASALAIFLLVRAGQISISHAGGSGTDDTDLNAYVLGFIGVVSGLLSDRAMDRLTAAGRNLLQGDQAGQGAAGGEAAEAEASSEREEPAPAAPQALPGPLKGAA